MGITFSQNSNLAGSIYGASEAPIKMFMEKTGKAFEQESLLPHLFYMYNSENFGDMFSAMTSMEDFMPVGENGAHPMAGMQATYEKLLRHVTWKNKFSISREMVEDAKLMDLKSRPEAFVESYYRAREKHGAKLYAYAAQGKTSMTVNGQNFDLTSADKVAQFSTSHPSIVGKKTQTNLFSDAFSNEALGAMETHMQNVTDDKGEVLDIQPTTIMIPNDHAMKMEVFAAIGADKDPDTEATSRFNYNFGRWNVIVNPYLNQYLAEGVKPWFLLADGFNQKAGGAVWGDRTELDVTPYVDNGNDASVWNGFARFNAVFNNWRFAACGGMTGGTKLL